MKTMQEFDNAITNIENKYPTASPNRQAVIALNGLIYRLASAKASDRPPIAEEIKAHLRSHVGDKDLHADLQEICRLFLEALEAGFNDIKREVTTNA